MTAGTLNGVQIRRRFLVLHGLRWMPVGILIPSLVLLSTERGISLGDIGLAMSLRGFVWLFMDLPAGGLADTWGRRPVLLSGGVVNLAGFVCLAAMPNLTGLMLFSVLQGVFRGLDSGALKSWFVDASLASGEPDAVEKGLRHSGAVLGYAIGLGCVLSGGLVLLDPIPGVSALNAPTIAGAVLAAVSLVSFWLLVPETKPHAEASFLPFAKALRTTPAAIGGALKVVGTSRTLLMLVLVELLWGFGMVAYEVLIPVRLDDVTSADTAAALLSPASAAAWFVSSLGVAMLPWMQRRLGRAGSAAVLRLVQGAIVVGMGLAAGPVGALIGYLACYVVHGAATPLHDMLLHSSVPSTHRAAASSVNSTATQLSNALGLLVLSRIADGSSAIAFVVAGIALAAAAPLYLAARGGERPEENEAAEPEPGANPGLTATNPSDT
ncbi:MFS transporter [Streptomyces sp. NPDC057496]|uniref:MFS transporter n=1 Tax=Streptomyces sp. NPDC057496 TaxID=3346149 RepID=UPI0036B8D52B